MLVPAILQTIWAFFKWVVNAVYKHTKALVKKTLRYLLRIGRPSLGTQQGFVLPTTVLLLLVVTLTVGAMTLRTLNRTGQVIGDRQQRIIYNAATPALERAKAKLEFMFDSQRDTRYPAGIPDQDFLYSMMLNDGVTGDATLFEPFGAGIDPYTFPDENGNYDTEEAESRISIDDDNDVDNAWQYRVDLDEDGTLDATVAYSILFNKPPDTLPNGQDNPARLANASEAGVNARAEALQVRHGPLSVPVQDDGCGSGGSRATEDTSGWLKPEAGGATLYKNFQVNALVIPDDGSTAATLEFHQDRKIDEGNKWGAWFRNDLEIFPGAKFNWNGAMHTEGSFFVARGTSNKPGLEAYLISSPASCYYSREDSEITVADRKTSLQSNNFEGQFVVSKLETSTWNDSNDAIIHLFDPDGNIPKENLNRQNDSVVDGGNAEDADSYLLDPVVLLTEDVSRARGFASADLAENGNPAPGRDADWTPGTSNFLEERRLYNNTEATPSVDDSFRADNRYGPKPRVNGKAIPDRVGGTPGKIGDAITGNRLEAQGLTDDDLIRLGPASGDEAGDFNNVGLDGYWERRARAEGMRVIVGQRLELGNTFGWGGVDQEGDSLGADEEPLMPWEDCDSENSTGNSGLCAQSRQRRSLRDNLAAVQAATVYHANATGVDKDFPVACLASTVHPGTPFTLAKSATFLNWLKGSQSVADDPPSAFWNDLPAADRPNLLISDFFRGEGTNGWEYETPSGGNPATFASDLAATAPLGKALRNLAHYAGDPFAGAPSFTPQQDTLVHPYPLISMWGDFSVLRRIFDDELDSGVTYANLSPADKTTLQTAACSLGMLANELYYLQTFNYDLGVERVFDNNVGNEAPYLEILNARLVALMLDKNDAGSQLDYEENYVKPALGLGPSDSLPDYWEEPPLGTGSVSDGYNGRNSENIARGRRNYEYYDDTNNFADQTDFDGLDGAPPEAYIARLEQWRDADITAIQRNDVTPSLRYFAVDDDLINLAKIVMLREQTLRDRSWGFGNGESPRCGPDSSFTYSTAYGDPAIGGGDPSFGIMRDWEGLNQLCTDQAKFGVLHSIFPGDQTFFSNNVIDSGDNHAEGANGNDARPGDAAARTVITNSLNPGYTYVAITTDDLKDIKLAPRDINDWRLPHGAFDSLVDYTDADPLDAKNPPSISSRANPNSNSVSYVVCSQDFCKPGGASGGIEGTLPPVPTVPPSHRTRRMPVAFKDAGLYNSREFMSVRVMDMDLEMLRQDSTGLSNADRWLPNAGIVYAFREDATREDAITRPARALWTNCNTDAAYANGPSTCHMSSFNEDARDSKDPPLAANAISPKPVDYAPDPDRRPNGFRLFNGEKLQRPGDEGRGLSLITDNAAYIKGDFNLHQNSAGTPLEEFEDFLLYPGGDFSKFYQRQNRDEEFATIAGDEWRPSEILADAITILSANFCDGSMFDSFHAASTGTNKVQVRDVEQGSRREIRVFNGSSVTRVKKPWRTLYGCNNPDSSKFQTSYSNGLLPEVLITATAHELAQADSLSGLEEYWHHENPYDTQSPYAITREGNPRMPQTATAYDSNYFEINELTADRQPGRAADTTVNAIIVSGTIPTRAGQSYGGLHNFPRLIERWQSRNLRIAGSLMQLSFSHTSTAPYDQDAWEPGAESDKTNERNGYYFAPIRLWGYDVGLQKGVAGPMARRFTSGAEPTRSEFYSEPPADDPYIRNLCQAIRGAANCPQQ